MPEATSINHVRVTRLSRVLLESLAKASGQSMTRYLERLLRGQALVVGLDMSQVSEAPERGGKR